VTEAQIKNRIKQLVGERTETPVDWIVHQIITEHPLAEWSDSDFYECCAYTAVRGYTRAVYRDMRQGDIAAEAEDRQLVFPGFERLQRRYIIERDGDMVAVALEAMTDAEIAAKVSELRRDAQGCLRHADELERFKHDRPGMAA
jgi:hypothetical protein